MMTLTPEMLISKWHLIAVVFILIAWISLIVGKYERKVILRSGAGATLLLYLIITIPIAVITNNQLKIEETMLNEVESNYERRIEGYAGDPKELHVLSAAAASFRDNDTYEVYIYAGNYSPTNTYKGSLHIVLYNKEGKVLKDVVYENLEIAPGEKVKIQKLLMWEYFERYTYSFLPD